MDEMRRQVREAADTQFAAVLSELAARLSPEPAEEAVIEEPPVEEQVVGITPPAASLPEPAARPRSYWSWLAL
jgi:hypothetical protein